MNRWYLPLMGIFLTLALTAQDDITFEIERRVFSQAETPLAVTTSSLDAVVGLQFSITWMPDELVLDSVGQFGLPGLDEGNFGLQDSGDGVLSVAWDDSTLEGLTFGAGDTLFLLYFMVEPTAPDTSFVRFSDTPTPPFVFTFNNGVFGTITPSLEDGYIRKSAALAIADTQITMVSCADEADGSIRVFPVGGVPPYTFFWDEVQGVDSLTNLAEGTYELEIVDGVGTSLTATYEIFAPDPLLLTEQLVNPTCPGQADGQITIDVTGGTAPFDFSWDQGASTSVLSMITEGSYFLTVTDANGCMTSAEYELQAPSLVQDVEITLPSCNIGDNGQISIFSNEPNLTYNWSNGGSEATQTGLSAGGYSVTVSSNQGCQEVLEFELDEPPTIDPNLSVINGCGDGNARITANPLNGVPPFSYAWSTGATQSQLFNLMAGAYTVTVTDDLGCEGQATVIVDFVSPLQVDVFPMDVSCPGAQDGSIALEVSGGVPPYEISWSTGESGNFIEGLSGGSYSVNVSTGANCNINLSITVDELPGMEVFILEEEVADGLWTVSALVSGGVPPYSYNWSTGASGSEVTGLTDGQYEVTITDANACQKVQSFTLGVTNTEVLAQLGDWLVFPNPNKGTFQIQRFRDGTLINTGDLRVELFDATGQQVWQGSLTDGLVSLAPNALSAGMYWLRVADPAGILHQQRIIVH